MVDASGSPHGAVSSSHQDDAPDLLNQLAPMESIFNMRSGQVEHLM